MKTLQIKSGPLEPSKSLRFIVSILTLLLFLIPFVQPLSAQRLMGELDAGGNHEVTLATDFYGALLMQTETQDRDGNKTFHYTLSDGSSFGTVEADYLADFIAGYELNGKWVHTHIQEDGSGIGLFVADIGIITTLDANIKITPSFDQDGTKHFFYKKKNRLVFFSETEEGKIVNRTNGEDIVALTGARDIRDGVIIADDQLLYVVDTVLVRFDGQHPVLAPVIQLHKITRRASDSQLLAEFSGLDILEEDPIQSEVHNGDLYLSISYTSGESAFWTINLNNQNQDFLYQENFDGGVKKLISFQEKIYFVAQNEIRELMNHKSELVESNLFYPRAFNPYAEANEVLVVANDILYFVKRENNKIELWKRDGLSSNSQRVTSFQDNTTVYSMALIGARKGKPLFVTSTPELGQELYRTDGTTAGTKLIKDFDNSEMSSLPKFVKTMNKNLFLIAKNEEGNTSLYAMGKINAIDDERHGLDEAQLITFPNPSTTDRLVIIDNADAPILASENGVVMLILTGPSFQIRPAVKLAGNCYMLPLRNLPAGDYTATVIGGPESGSGESGESISFKIRIK